LVKEGKVSCTQRELDLGMALTATAWISGNFGLDWFLWPEEDPKKLGDCVKQAWEAISKQQKKERYRVHSLEGLVARKMRDYIGERRSLLWKSIRDIVGRQYATEPENMDTATRSNFWKQKAENHAILSPDINRVGYKKWTSDIIIKCLTIFYDSDNMWAKTPLSIVPGWWKPLPGFTIVAVCTMIIAACMQASMGSAIRFDSVAFRATFMQIKESWQAQDSVKEQATMLLVTKKVHRAMASRLAPTEPEPIPNEYEDTLDDLVDDPDFAEFKERFNLPESDTVGNETDSTRDQTEKPQDHEEDGSVKESSVDDDTDNDDEDSNGEENIVDDDADNDDEDSNGEENIVDDNANNNDADLNVIPRTDENSTGPNTEVHSDNTTLVSDILPVVKETFNDSTLIKTRKLPAKEVIEPAPKRRKTTRSSKAQEDQLQRKIQVKFNDDYEDFNSTQNRTFSPNCTWEEFTRKFGQDVNCTMFWIAPDSWDEKQRDGKTHAMCQDKDLEGMFAQVQKGEWECVYVIDTHGQYDEPVSP